MPCVVEHYVVPENHVAPNRFFQMYWLKWFIIIKHVLKSFKFIYIKSLLILTDSIRPADYLHEFCVIKF